MTNNRILIFDIGRIIAIILVVAEHMALPGILSIGALNQSYGIAGFEGNIGNWGVILFILISGCALEYTYGKKIRDVASKFNYRLFIEKRLLRIYPAYWFSILLALLFNIGLLSKLGWIEYVRTLSGFYAFTTISIPQISALGGPINAMGWFIGLIVCLYLLFPLISRFLTYAGFSGLTLIFFLSWFVVISLPSGYVGLSSYWFPLARLFEFSLGIYIVQMGFYLKTANNFKAIRFLSDLSFPVFLVHTSVLYILILAPHSYYENIILYLIVVLILSLIVYQVDKYFKTIFEKYILSSRKVDENSK
jgi:peptidoglycan/LPS O-acetylase OafA/YrhL